MLNVRFVNIEQGRQKFEGDANLFKNMLLTFDRITLDDSLKRIYQSILRGGSLNRAIEEAINLQKTAQTIEAQGLSSHTASFAFKLQQFENVQERTFHALVALETFIEIVQEFKEELKVIANAPYLNNQQTVKEIQYDIRATLHNYNNESQNLAKSGVKAMNISQINQYENHSEMAQAAVLAETIFPDTQNQNYSYYMSVQKLKENLQGQNPSYPVKDHLTFKDQLLKQQAQINNYEHGMYNEVQSGQSGMNGRPAGYILDARNDQEQHNQSNHCSCNIF